MFTLEEQIILNNIDRKWKYIARDKNGKLCLYDTRPLGKSSSFWLVENGYFHFPIFKHLFKNIKWEDEEPTEIKRDESSTSKSFKEIDYINYWYMHELGKFVTDSFIKHDVVNNPKHYQGKYGLEAMDVLRNFMTDEEVKGFHFGNTLKYLLRHENKNGVEDLRKARKNLDWLIELYEKEK